MVHDKVNPARRPIALGDLPQRPHECGSLAGRPLWRRFEVHYTPKHASWLNAAELEASLVSRECLGRDRISSLVELISRVSAWRRAAESAGRTIDWTFRVDDARRKFRYDGLITARSRH